MAQINMRRQATCQSQAKSTARREQGRENEPQVSVVRLAYPDPKKYS